MKPDRVTVPPNHAMKVEVIRPNSRDPLIYCEVDNKVYVGNKVITTSCVLMSHHPQFILGTVHFACSSSPHRDYEGIIMEATGIMIN